MISPPRFSTYLNYYEGAQKPALRLYAWNIELSSAFWGPLGILEVLLRNSMHAQLSKGRRDDWWNADEVHLMDREGQAFSETVRKLEKAGNTNPTADDVVGSSSFGVWVGLLDVGVPRHHFLDYPIALWEPRLKHAFPHLNGVKRKQLHGELNRIRIFRNRVAHHEPIFRANSASTIDLIATVAGYIDPDIQDFIKGAHRVDTVLARKKEAVADEDCCI